MQCLSDQPVRQCLSNQADRATRHIQAHSQPAYGGSRLFHCSRRTAAAGFSTAADVRGSQPAYRRNQAALAAVGTTMTGQGALRSTYWLTVPSSRDMLPRVARTMSCARASLAASTICRPAIPATTRSST
jgi:hypothetical protein